MNKVILTNTEYTFNASNKTVVVSNYLDYFTKEYLLIITNTSENTIIYNFACEGYGGTISGNTLTLEYDTTSMSDTDNLQIILYLETSNADTSIIDLLELIKKQTEVQDEILEELKVCSKYLKKIYNPE